ncbi:MAG TPA: PEP-CTERM sorting domain-containing protein [Roseiarcus sp.]|nr:PEP-CTERM sorting domain-containing protein [Roseiarcus sp.]
MPGNYSLFESIGSYNYTIEETGTLSVAATPEASTWAMFALGFASLVLFGRRKSERLAPALG